MKEGEKSQFPLLTLLCVMVAVFAIVTWVVARTN
jgi:hypothetical protein